MNTTYWDLTEKERSQLSESEVERHGDFELMTKGVLKVTPPKLIDVPKMPEPDLEVHVVMFDAWNGLDVASDRADECVHILNSCLHIRREYVGGQHVDVARPFDDKASVRIKRVYSEKTFTEARGSIERANAAKSANERAIAANNEAHTKQSQALKGLWQDWHECVAKHERLGRIVTTFHDYVKTAGDNVIAASFLAKAFHAGDIAEAAEWFEVAIPMFTSEDKEATKHDEKLARDIAAELEVAF